MGWLVAAGVVAAVALPFAAGLFWVHVFTEILILGLFAMSFNLLFGFTGQLSFGHAAYYGVGVYATALLLTKTSLPLAVCMAASIVLAGAFALAFGFFCVRLTGIYFSILSLALGQFVYYVIFNWYEFTGGDNGIQGVSPPLALRDPYAYYYFTLVVVAAASVLMWRIVNSPFGYTLRAIRDNADRTRFIGIDVRRYVLICFVIAGMFAGLAGALWAPFARSVSPDLANWTQSGLPVFMTILGGPSHLLGPMVGSAIYTFLSAFVTGFTVYWPLTIGTIIIFIVLLMPGGVLGAIDAAFAARRTRRRASNAEVVHGSRGEGVAE
ncbi:MAG TPA: branched-chain amino acid ABC transporter permease [Plasticicumulans sp.]|nr:branched-chain amino acid ABC transporter permease [Plasticicumulans sp.]HND97942.1 branched-chain amino acid ABC transporter permease [Plasticicumulans sp.]HNE00063.1 branched-chain amino acid ABC transporter permease [Plasticicumulans sp.]HNO59008.1 branched-chain amino acid ABC transporter permease [Plasticicumulans sp.]